MRNLVFGLFLLFPGVLTAQIFNYWSHNFSEESSLVGGAVVGGGSGSSSIFYNPAIISDIGESKLSVNMSLYSYDYLKYNNALGYNIDMYSSRLYMIPRNVSLMVKSPKHPLWNFEIAFLNVANFSAESMSNTDKNMDILTYLPGTERYTSYSYTRTELTNDFLGIGGSRKISERFYFGSSIFISFKSLYSAYFADINAYPLEPVYVDGNEVPFYTATFSNNELVKFTDYRLLFKIGFFYKASRFSAGLNITPPSIGRIYSDGKRVMRDLSQANITNPVNGNPLPDYIVTDYAEVKDVKVNSRTPFSISAGSTFHSKDNKKTFYTTIEYFAPIAPYRMVKANESPELAGGVANQFVNTDDWLTYVDGAKPIVNFAFGYRWILKKNLIFLGGIKTNFSYKKNLDVYPFQSDKQVKSVDLDYYHLSGGLTLHIFGQDITAGLQYKLGINRNQTQFINLSDPVEFDFVELKALQGTRQKTMNSYLNSLSILVSATFNFTKSNKN